MMFHESRDNGWVMVRRNLVPHVESGRMSMDDFAVHLMLVLIADSDNGQTVTCASAIRKLFHCGPELNERDMQRILDRLERRGYIHRAIVPGRRGLYTITVNKYPITTGPQAGEQAKITSRIKPRTGIKRGTDRSLRMVRTSHRERTEDGSEGGAGSSEESTGSVDCAQSGGAEDALRTHRRVTEDGTDDAPIQHRYGIKKQETEKETVVVVEAQQKEKDDSPLFIVPNTDESGEGEGYGAEEDGSLNAHLDSSDPTGAPSSKHEPDQTHHDALDAEWEDILPVQARAETEPAPETNAAAAPAAPARPADPLDSPFEVQPVGSAVEAHRLVEHFYSAINSPPQFKDKLNAWMKPAARLLGQLSLAELQGVIAFAMSRPYWAEGLLNLNRDPLEFLEGRIESDGPLSLLAQYRAHQLSRSKPKQKEHRNGKEATRNPAGKSAAELRTDAIAAAGDDAEQALRRRYGKV
jgi:hypothetical protein